MKKLLENITWLVTAIGALNWGLEAIGFNIFYTRLFYMIPGVVFPFKLLVGVAGIYSLLMFFVPGLCSSCKK